MINKLPDWADEAVIVICSVCFPEAQKRYHWGHFIANFRAFLRGLMATLFRSCSPGLDPSTQVRTR